MTTGDEPMSVYPKIEVKRYVDASDLPHELRICGEYVDDLTDAEADRWEALAKFTVPLPDGVRLAMVARGDEIPEGWERNTNDGIWLNGPTWSPTSVYEVRPPSQPATEKVPLHEAMGRTLPNGQVIDSISYTLGHLPEVWCGRDRHEADADGMVEVLVES